ncbi:YHS domain-containing protein [Soonwooa sp.]|uniref:YHS domain-containing protein n=1 Tax=Soonwooa sp. TaxID=1938592 RepID=UPI002630E6B4|nr:YHS domain-containing protein [Soonwooa sp.]
MKNLVLAGIAIIALASCEKKNLEVKHVSDMESQPKITAKVVNEEDPVCHMKTAGHVSDTVTYKAQVYGFCSSICKDEFKKNPDSYIK